MKRQIAVNEIIDALADKGFDIEDINITGPIFKEGKYLACDISDYVCWCCENKFKKPVNNFMVNYIIICACAEYKRLCDKSLIWDYTIEKWGYSFIMPDVFYNCKYQHNYDPFDVIKGVKFPNEKVSEEEIEEQDKKFIDYIISVLINIPHEKIRDNMSNMELFKNKTISKMYNNTPEYAEIYIDELANEFEKEQWFKKLIGGK